jgi:hypothetical protein
VESSGQEVDHRDLLGPDVRPSTPHLYDLVDLRLHVVDLVESGGARRRISILTSQVSC